MHEQPLRAVAPQDSAGLRIRPAQRLAFREGMREEVVEVFAGVVEVVDEDDLRAGEGVADDPLDPLRPVAADLHPQALLAVAAAVGHPPEQHAEVLGALRGDDVRLRARIAHRAAARVRVAEDAHDTHLEFARLRGPAVLALAPPRVPGHAGHPGAVEHDVERVGRRDERGGQMRGQLPARGQAHHAKLLLQQREASRRVGPAHERALRGRHAGDLA